MKPLKPEPPRKLPEHLATLPYSTSAERDAYITAEADYFTVGRWRGHPQGYERHEVKSLIDAENLARRMANETGKVYMIYAVAGIHDAFIKSVHSEVKHARTTKG